MRIFIEVKPYAAMRYPTLGDWYEDGHGAKIDVADLGDWRMNLLVAVHEMVESALCEHRGIPEDVVRAFDEAHLDADDPGSLEDAPYMKEHVFAEAIEKQIARELGVDWDAYEAKCREIAR